MHNVYCVILDIFTINVSGIGAYFVYFYWYLKKDSLYVDFNTYKDGFDASMLKIDKKNYKEIDVYYIGYVTLLIAAILTV